MNRNISFLLLCAILTLTGAASAGETVQTAAPPRWGGRAFPQEIKNLQALLATPAGENLMADVPSLAILHTFDPESFQHRKAAGFLVGQLPPSFNASLRSALKSPDEKAPQLRTLANMVAAAHEKAAPPIASLAQNSAEKIIAGIALGNLDRDELLKRADELKSWGLYGHRVSANQNVKTVQAMADVARFEKTLDTAKKIAAELIQGVPPVNPISVLDSSPDSQKPPIASESEYILKRALVTGRNAVDPDTVRRRVEAFVESEAGVEPILVSNNFFRALSLLANPRQVPGPKLPAELEQRVQPGHEMRLYFSYGERRIRLTIRRRANGDWSFGDTTDQPSVNEDFRSQPAQHPMAAQYSGNELFYLSDREDSRGPIPALRLQSHLRSIRRTLLKEAIISQFGPAYEQWKKLTFVNMDDPTVQELFLRDQKYSFTLDRGLVPAPKAALSKTDAQRLVGIHALIDQKN